MVLTFYAICAIIIELSVKLISSTEKVSILGVKEGSFQVFISGGMEHGKKSRRTEIFE